MKVQWVYLPQLNNPNPQLGVGKPSQCQLGQTYPELLHKGGGTLGVHYKPVRTTI